MTTPIDFYFDFSSPYGYIASEKIDALAARYNRTVNWHPILLGAVFKVTQSMPVVQLPGKGDYYKHDFARSARYLGVPFKYPSVFPIATQNAARLFLWLNGQNQDVARQFAHACFRAFFVDDKNISELPQLVDVASRFGLDTAAVTQVVNEQAVKDLLRKETDTAIARGVIGSPFFIVDNETFWGADRLPQLERWLQTGGF